MLYINNLKDKFVRENKGQRRAIKQLNMNIENVKSSVASQLKMKGHKYRIRCILLRHIMSSQQDYKILQGKEYVLCSLPIA